MFKLNSLEFTNGPEPYPPADKPMDYWNKYYVKMPNSPSNTFKEEYKILGISKEREVTFWSVIEKCLSQKMTKFEDLDKMIRQYNHYEDYDFDVLRSFLEPQPIVSNAYSILNYLAQLALKLPQWVTRSVPHLKGKNNCTLILSQKQIACLLANGFFCTFPRRSRENQEYKNFPCFNFVR